MNYIRNGFFAHQRWFRQKSLGDRQQHVKTLRRLRRPAEAKPDKRESAQYTMLVGFGLAALQQHGSLRTLSTSAEHGSLRTLSTSAGRTGLLRMMGPEEDPLPAAELAMLGERISRLQAGEAQCRCVILRETLVPGQRLAICAPPELVDLFARPDGQPIVLLGKHGGGGRPTTDYGVEVTVEGEISYRPVVPGIHPEGTADIVCAAGRLCKVIEMQADAVGVQRAALVQWADLDGTSSEATRDAADAAILKRSESLEGGVEEWLRLVRLADRQRFPNHIDDVIDQLGPIPAAERPNSRALWVAGLINPSPPLGVSSSAKPAAMGPSVAPEIRAEVMSAATVEARIGAVVTALNESLRRLRKMVGEEEA